MCTTESSTEVDHQLVDISPIKKERIKRQKKKALQQKLRDGLPVLTAAEIRRYRLPCHEALLMELKETGFSNSAEFIRQLIQLQDKQRAKYGTGSPVWMRPQLKFSSQNLDMLAKSLSKAEAAHKAGSFGKQWDEILQLAANYAFGPEDWWWLGEQLLYQAVSMEYSGDFNKQEAIAYFIIGKYLVENGKKSESGRHYLDLARSMSQGKSWTCSKILNKKQDIVFIESCRLLYVTLMEEALSLMKQDPARAAETCNLARKRAAEACDYEGEYQALLLRGKCELLLNETSEAIGTMTKVLNRTVRRKSIKGICEAKIALSLAYLQHGKPAECLECLKDVKTLADEYNMPFYQGQAFRFMGEYYLNQNNPSEATSLLRLAFYIFHEIRDLRRREKVRTWSAISAGAELFPSMVTLIRDCDDPLHGHENLQKLINWIDEKEPFWTQETKFVLSYTSLRQFVD